MITRNIKVTCQYCGYVKEVVQTIYDRDGVDVDYVVHDSVFLCLTLFGVLINACLFDATDSQYIPVFGTCVQCRRRSCFHGSLPHMESGRFFSYLTSWTKR